MHRIISWITECRQVLKSPAHRAERPAHLVYFVSVAYYAHDNYYITAACCAAVTILSWGED